MNAISLDNSLHFSGSPFAFLETFSLDRGTPMYLTTQQLESKVHLHKTTFPLLAHIAHCGILYTQTLHSVQCTRKDIVIDFTGKVKFIAQLSLECW